MPWRSAIRYLLDRQSPDGTWRDFLTLAGEAIDWPTAYIVATLAPVADGDLQAALARARVALVARQHGDGGWGYHAGVPTDADSTAWALLALASGDPAAPPAMARAAGCLRRHQRPGGGLPTYAEPAPIRGFMQLPEATSIDGWCQPHLEVTATAGRALAAAGDTDGALAAWRFVAPRQRADGSWRSYWWTLAHVPTLQAASLARALPAGPGSREAMERAAGWTLSAQRSDGSWATPEGRAAAFATAVALTLLAGLATEPSAPVQAAVARGAEALAALQQIDGSWPSEPMMRIPPPSLAEPDAHTGWRPDALGTGVVIADQHRLYTTATAAAALALAARR